MNKKTAIVTGASRGIGAQIAIALAEDGYNIVLCCHSNTEQAAAVASRCTTDTLVVSGDCSDSGTCDKWAALALGRFGSIDVLVNNAGKTSDALLVRMTDKQFDDVMQTNLYGAFYMTRAVSKAMIKARSGRIINISSVSGIHGNAGQANYSASKAGLIGLTKTSAKELAGRGITVNAIAPGLIETEMTENIPEIDKQKIISAIAARRMGKPEEIAAIVSFLASEHAGYINGQVISADGLLAL